MNRSLHKLGFFLPLNTLRNARNQQEPFFTLILLITFICHSYLPLHPTLFTPAPETGPQLGCPWAGWQSRVTPWPLGFKGPLVSDLWPLKSLSVSQSHSPWAPRASEPRQRQVTGCLLIFLIHAPVSFLSRQKRSSTWCAGTCNVLTMI